MVSQEKVLSTSGVSIREAVKYLFVDFVIWTQKKCVCAKTLLKVSFIESGKFSRTSHLRPEWYPLREAVIYVLAEFVR